MATKKKDDGHFFNHSKILEFNMNVDAQLITKSNFIFGASTLVLMFVLYQVFAEKLILDGLANKLPWLILIIGSFTAALLSMMVIMPKIFLFSKKKRVKEDIFYYKNINKFYSREKYADYLYDLPRNERKVSDAYAHQIYSLANTILPFKFKMIKISGWMLTFSILLSILTYFAMSLF
ncbi:hypothetical protein HOE37_03950 [Candidatus Woesearchaeota archaeon]|jgi:hypothetical protein|nr:hypothetical protein [Candidatus Woesearchaeota archaeon]MBT4110985.1 hypothetical protein [Candidatus Woesearchaeota archaeon]MBT4336854.1 hypothetical protein [Candidatus Woesearchaeota archaeon]MBT4469831.1 hypothetical protein [Candidatus Woesearchaeota archaeon]MBT6743698.1 hypothetical protein [Candidatus Woesearchaeota archaeon]